MKTLKIATIILFTTASVLAQDLRTNEVPQAVINTFKSLKTEASDIEWEKEANFYKVEFETNRKDQEIWFTETGEITRMEKELYKNELPQAVINFLKESYASYTYDDIVMITIGDKISYEVEAEKGTSDKKLVIDEKGNLMDSFVD